MSTYKIIHTLSAVGTMGLRTRTAVRSSLGIESFGQLLGLLAYETVGDTSFCRLGFAEAGPVKVRGKVQTK